MAKSPDPAALADIVAEAVKDLIRPLRSQLTDLQQQVIELRARPSFSYEGAHVAGKFYEAGQSVTSDGNLWVCVAPTTMKPGTDPTWQLA